MSSKRRSVSGLVKFFVVITAGLLVLSLSLLFISRFIQHNSRPEITIISPDPEAIFTSGEMVEVVSVGQARRGLHQIEFYVNDIFQARYSILPGDTPSEATFAWFPSQSGIHQLTVIAYDQQGKSSQPASVFVGVKPMIPPFPVQLVENNQQQNNDQDSVAVGAEQNEQVPEFGENAPFQSFEDEDQLDELFLEVDPEDQFPFGFEDQSPRLQVVPDMERIEGGVKAIALIDAVDDLGLDYISLTLLQYDNVIDEFTYPCGGRTVCDWNYSVNFSQGEWTIIIQAFDSIGQSSETYRHTFQYLPEEGDQAPAIVLSDDVDPGDFAVVTPPDFLGEPSISGTDCDGRLIELDVPYRYTSDHGDLVYVGAWAQKDGIMVAAGHTQVGLGSGTAQFTMEPIAPDLVETTEQLQLHFMTPEGEYFHEQTVDIDLTWSVPLPDLAIQEVIRSINGDTIKIQVKNNGCSSIQGFELATETELGPGPLHTFPDNIQPGITKEVSIFNVDPNLYSRLFDVRLDPDNKIDEINENNNVHLTFPIQIDYVHISKLDIHDTSDGEWHQDPDQGEFRLYVTQGGASVERPRGEDETWILPKGSWDINGFVAPIYLHPELDWNQDLWFLFEIIEHDDVGSSDHTFVEILHPWDMNNPESWKWNHGQEQVATTNNGYYTIHYWVVLKD